MTEEAGLDPEAYVIAEPQYLTAHCAQIITIIMAITEFILSRA